MGCNTPIGRLPEKGTAVETDIRASGAGERSMAMLKGNYLLMVYGGAVRMQRQYLLLFLWLSVFSLAFIVLQAHIAPDDSSVNSMRSKPGWEKDTMFWIIEARMWPVGRCGYNPGPGWHGRRQIPGCGSCRCSQMRMARMPYGTYPMWTMSPDT